MTAISSTAAYHRAYRAMHREQKILINRRYNQRVREKILDFYGRKCAKCTHADVRVLQVDHIYNDGAEERRKGVTIWKRIQTNPERYQLLCANCNWLKRSEQGLGTKPRTSPTLDAVA